MQNTIQGQSNPLQGYFRQPKIYIKLPSNGNFWEVGSIDIPENGEYPVYAMTAKDEITMRTADGLMNGQATVDVIKSCMPNLKDPWKMPSIDLDAVFIAMKIATYGENMDMKTTVPGTDMEKDFTVDLRKLLDLMLSQTYNTEIKVDELTLNIKPMNYQEYTKNSLATFEEQRIFSIVNDNTLSDSQKNKAFQDAFKKLTELNVRMVIDSIHSIQVGEDIVSDRRHINEFIENADKKFYDAVFSSLEVERKKFAVQPFEFTATPEEKEAGAQDQYTIPVLMDPSNFFAQGS